MSRHVTAATDLQRPAEFRQVVIRTVNGLPVRIGDVARVASAPADERSSVRLNGRDSVALGVIRQATANPLDLSAGVRQLLTRVERDLPPGVTIEVANDNSVFIDRSIQAVYRTIAEAVVPVALVIFVFLRTLRASIIPLLTIPVALIGAFALMALVGFSVNTLTLLALALATGAGAESRRQIGWVIVGGMSLGTLLTIFVVPTMYSLLARKHAPGAKKEAAVDSHTAMAPHAAQPAWVAK